MLSNVHLILFFDIYNIIKLTKSCQVDVDVHVDEGEARSDGATSTEREIQTELHPIPFHKDEGYVWNLWDLRRKAIELVSERKFRDISNNGFNSRRIFVARRQLPLKRRCPITSSTLEISGTRSVKKVCKPTPATRRTLNKLSTEANNSFTEIPFSLLSLVIDFLFVSDKPLEDFIMFLCKSLTFF